MGTEKLKNYSSAYFKKNSKLMRRTLFRDSICPGSPQLQNGIQALTIIVTQGKEM